MYSYLDDYRKFDQNEQRLLLDKYYILPACKSEKQSSWDKAQPNTKVEKIRKQDSLNSEFPSAVVRGK